ncbi:hypothetical protein [Acinetobacter sp. YH01020]|uniref:hypothetical protein n=1 Tax=Acinetobacter sp. YH01020 TaxID=2601034 RepID=UPI0015D1F97A|nr:hypothetical protein [Acinetobacter sp. YH01020]
MKKAFNVAIFGLNLETLDQMNNQLLLSVPTDVNVQWVNISSNEIDLLLVNDMFFDSPNIQRVIQQQKSYLRLVKDVNQAGSIIEDKLFYPFTRLNQLVEWLEQRYFNYMGRQVNPIEDNFVLNSARNSAAQYSQTKVDHKSVFNEIFTPRNGYIQLYDHTGFLALIDTRTERVWFEQNQELYSLKDTINQTYAKNSFVHEMIKDKTPYDLRTWLWQAISHSGDLDLPKVDADHVFKLNIWPQFEKSLDRKDNLKIAACFALGAKVQDVQQHLGISLERVKKFVAIAQTLKLGELIEADAAKFSIEQKQENSGQVNKLRSFFGKLRKKLGL